jgi:hypothetical protein
MKRKRRSRETNEPRHPGWVVAGVSVVATVLWGLFGYSGDSIFGNAFPTFLGACERVKQAGIGPNSSDWFCQLSIGHIHVRFAESGLLIVAGLVITGMILAATGRRLSAFIPLGAAIVFDLGMLQNQELHRE